MSRAYRSATRRSAERRGNARRLLIIMFGISLVIAFIQTCTAVTGRTNPVSTGINRLATPLVVAVRYTGEGIASLGYIFRIPQLLRENKKLKSANTTLEREAAESDALVAENALLRQTLGLRRGDFRAVHASIVARPYDLWLDEVMINVGRRDGVIAGSLVTNPSGVVGVVDDNVGEDHAWVMLVTSPRFRVAAVTGISRTEGVLRGAAGQMKLENVRSRPGAAPDPAVVSSSPGDLDLTRVMAGSDVQLGEKIFTKDVSNSSSSSSAAIVPRPEGVYIGKVRHRDTDPNGFLHVIAEPAINPSRISIVTVWIR
jgi:cell shape-determining protein MreC